MTMRHRNAHHITFSPKYRRPVLPRVATAVEETIRHIARLHKIDILAMSIQHDHIHLFLDIPRTLSVAYAVQQVKWFSAIWIRKAYPGLVNKQSFWQQGYFSRSIGGDRARVQQYIENQGVKYDG